MIRYIKTFEVILSGNNLSGMHISAIVTVGTYTNTFVRLVYIYKHTYFDCVLIL